MEVLVDERGRPTRSALRKTSTREVEQRALERPAGVARTAPGRRSPTARLRRATWRNGCDGTASRREGRRGASATTAGSSAPESRRVRPGPAALEQERASLVVPLDEPDRAAAVPGLERVRLVLRVGSASARSSFRTTSPAGTTSERGVSTAVLERRAPTAPRTPRRVPGAPRATAASHRHSAASAGGQPEPSSRLGVDDDVRDAGQRLADPARHGARLLVRRRDRRLRVERERDEDDEPVARSRASAARAAGGR